MGRFNGMIFDTAFVIGEMVRGVARKVRQVELQALSSATLGLLPLNSPGLTDHEQYTSGSQRCYYLAAVQFFFPK